jgi:hypothetical protein
MPETGVAAGLTKLESELRVAGGMGLRNGQGVFRNPRLFDSYRLNDSPRTVQLCGQFSRLEYRQESKERKA